MSADKTPLISRLMLLALVLNLGCLVVIIFQLQSRKAADRAAANAIQAVPEKQQVAEAPEQASPPTFVTRRASYTVPDPAPPAPERVVEVVVAQPRIELPADAGGRIDVVATVHHDVAAGQGGAPVSVAKKQGPVIYGTVWLDGTPPEEIPISTEGTTCARLEDKPLTTRHYVVSQQGGLANVLVYVKSGLGKRKFPMSTNQPPLLETMGCQFEPYVMGVQAGQTFRIKNSDGVRHILQARSAMNRGFDFDLLHEGETGQATLSAPEIFVRVRCALHPWMFAYVGVLSHPFFAVTDSEGAFRLPPGLPSGRYLIAARHLKAGEAVAEVTVREDQETVIPFTLTVSNTALTLDR